MLAINNPKQTVASANPNIIPCKVNYNGPTNASKRHWNPETETSGQKTAYFRGRKLLGRDVVVPEGYKGTIKCLGPKAILTKSGLVLEKTGQTLPSQVAAAQPLGDDEEPEEDESEQPDVGLLKQVSRFDKITIWGHETLPLDEEDPYLKGMQEWMTFAQNV